MTMLRFRQVTTNDVSKRNPVFHLTLFHYVHVRKEYINLKGFQIQGDFFFFTQLIHLNEKDLLQHRIKNVSCSSEF